MNVQDRCAHLKSSSVRLGVSIGLTILNHSHAVWISKKWSKCLEVTALSRRMPYQVQARGCLVHVTPDRGLEVLLEYPSKWHQRHRTLVVARRHLAVDLSKEAEQFLGVRPPIAILMSSNSYNQLATREPAM